MPTLISLSGKAQHGKDTCASLLVELGRDYGVTVGRFAFAWPLKSRVYGEGAGEFALLDVLYNKPPALRKLLQEVGTERGRNVFGENFWTLQSEAMLQLFADAMPHIAVWVISDCRFPNEVAFVRNGGTVGERKGFTPPGTALWIASDRPTLTGAAAQHPSETALDALDKHEAFDGIISNNSDTSLLDLKEQLRPYLERALLRPFAGLVASTQEPA